MIDLIIAALAAATASSASSASPPGHAYEVEIRVVDVGLVSPGVMPEEDIISRSVDVRPYAKIQLVQVGAMPATWKEGENVSFKGHQPLEDPFVGTKVEITSVPGSDARIHVGWSSVIDDETGKRVVTRTIDGFVPKNGAQATLLVSAGEADPESVYVVDIHEDRPDGGR